MFYQNYGDSKPRFMVNIRDVSATLQHDMTSVRLIFPDKRSWLFEFENKLQAKQFEFAITETQRSLDESEQSLYIKGNRYEQLLRPFT